MIQPCMHIAHVTALLVCCLQVLVLVMVAPLSYNIKPRSVTCKPCSTAQKEEWKKLKGKSLTWIKHLFRIPAMVNSKHEL